MKGIVTQSRSSFSLALIVIAAIAVSLAGCAAFTGPVTGTYPPNTERFFPLDSTHRYTYTPQYSAWWKRVQACTGSTMPFERLNFFIVMNTINFTHNGTPAEGYFVAPMNLVLADLIVGSEADVEHEMVHAALYDMFGLKYYKDGKDGHPLEYFRDKCGFVSQNY